MKEYKYKINGNIYKVGVGDIDNGIAHIEVNGTPYNVELEQEAVKTVKVAKTTAPQKTGASPLSKPVVASTGAHAVKSPLPGVILSIPVKVGDTVKASDTVIVLEAMKMENAIHAGRDGKIASVNVNQGDSVLEGAVLLTID